MLSRISTIFLIVVVSLFTFVQAAPAGAPSGNITRAFYTNNPNYGPTSMYVHCIKVGGAGATVGLAIGKSSSLDYGCAYVYQVYVPAGGWSIDCNSGSGFQPKWSGEGWHDWPGTNQIACLWH